MRNKLTVLFVFIILSILFSLTSCKGLLELKINILPSSAEDAGNKIILDPSEPDGKYPNGTEVTLTIETTGLWLFEEWSGDNADDVIGSGTSEDPYKIVMDSNKSLTAIFNQSSDGKLVIEDTTNGHIRLDSHAGSEATPIEDTYPNGTTLTLYATPEAGYYFTGWTGVGEGSYDNPLEVDILGETVIGANFEPVDNTTIIDKFEGGFSDYWHAYMQNHSISAWPETEPVIDSEEYVNGDTSMKLMAVETAPNTHQRRCFYNVHVDVAQNSYISFWYKIDSYPDGDDGNYDKLMVIQDGDDVEEWMWVDGEVNWTKKTLQLTPGIHEINFGFYNFNQQVWGRNAAWIDDVVLGPGVTPILPEPEVKVYLNDNNNDDTIDPENLFEVEIDPNAAMPIDLGRLMADEPVQFTFQNRGLANLEITDISMDTSGTTGVNLDTTGINFPVTIPPFEYYSYFVDTSKFEVTLPSTTGAVTSGQIEITSNDGVNPSFTFSFSGTALQTVFSEDFEGGLTSNIWSDVFDHPVYSNYTGDTPPVISSEEAYSGSDSLKFIGDGINVNHIIKSFTIEVNSSTGAVLSFWINSNIIPYFATQHTNGWDYVYTFPDAYFLMSDDFEDDGNNNDGKPFLGHEKWSFRHHTNGWHQAIIELDQVGTHEIVWKFGHAGSIDDPVDDRVYIYMDNVVVAGDATMVSNAGTLDVSYEGSTIAEGSNYDVGDSIVGDPIPINLKNDSIKGNLTITDISMDSSNDASLFTIVNNPTDSGDSLLLPQEETQLILTVQNSATPITSGVITVTSDDPTNPTYTFTITASPLNAFFVENFEPTSGTCDWSDLSSGNTWTHQTHTYMKEGQIVYDLSNWSSFINPKYDTTYPSSGDCYIQFGVFEETEGGFSDSEPIDQGQSTSISINVDLTGYASATIRFDAAAYFWSGDPTSNANKFTFSQDGTVLNTIMQEENIQYTTYSIPLTTGSVSTLTWTFDKTEANYSGRGDATWLDNIFIVE